MKKLYLLIVLATVSVPLFCQSLAKQIAQSLDTLYDSYPIEKAFLHTDRDAYTVGETIWLKAYLGIDNIPSNLSKVVYVELVNEKNQLVEKRMLKVDNGSSAGDIRLDNKLPAGTYVINAYTRWMLNFPGNIFSKHIYIYNTDLKKKTATPEVSIKFSPEGETFVAGVENVVAFKSVFKSGLPADVKGKIVDSKNNFITDFSSAHDGMNSFKLTPVAGEQYSALVDLPNGKQQSILLPQPATEGIAIQVSTAGNKTYVRVNRAESNKDKYNQLFVAAVMNRQLAYFGSLNIDEGLDAAAVPIKDLPAGVMHIFVGDNNGNILTSRRVFINKNVQTRNVISQLNLDKNKRSLNEYALNLQSKAKADVSVSVVNPDAQTTNANRQSILSAFLLTGELNGHIHHPAWYFSDTSTERQKGLDLLMLNHQFLQLDYAKIFKKQFPKLTHMVESGIAITGKALKPGTNTEIKSGRVNIWVKGEDSTSILTQAELNNGSFYIPNVDFRKTAKLYYQGTKAEREAALMEVKIYPSFFDTLRTPHAAPVVDLAFSAHENKLPQAIQQKLEELRMANEKVLAEVKITGKKKSVADSLNNVYATNLFELSDQSFMPDSNSNYVDIWQLLRTKVSGLSVNRLDTGTQVLFDRYSGLTQFTSDGDNSVVFFLNEVPTSLDIIESLNPNDVAYVKVYKGATAIPLGVTRGAIALYTKKGATLRDWRQKGLNVTEMAGYSVASRFPAINHGSNNGETSNDQRSTLYWVPSVHPGRDGKTIIRFYNDDHAERFKITVQGFDREGNLIYDELTTD
jgi:hypothetical protein